MTTPNLIRTIARTGALTPMARLLCIAVATDGTTTGRTGTDLSDRQLAGIVGTTEGTISVMLSRLRRDGWLRRGRKRVEIVRAKFPLRRAGRPVKPSARA